MIPGMPTSSTRSNLSIDGYRTLKNALFWAFMVIALIVAVGMYWAISVKADDKPAYIPVHTPVPTAVS